MMDACYNCHYASLMHSHSNERVDKGSNYYAIVQCQLVVDMNINVGKINFKATKRN